MKRKLALQAGDVEEAKRRLLAAGKTSGSPALRSFGPNMALAEKLLEKGERDVVLEYFELCKKFWAGESYRMGRDVPNAFRRYNRCRWDFPESDAAKYSRGRLALPDMLAQFEKEANLTED